VRSLDALEEEPAPRRLETEIDRIESIPAIPDGVKQVVRDLSGKLESFFARGRG